MKMNRIASLALFVSQVFAFENTVPCVLWSPQDYILNTPQTLTGSSILSLTQDICSAQLVVLVDQPQLHSNDFVRSENKESFEALKDWVNEAKTQAHIEYMKEGVNLQAVADTLADQCGSTIAHWKVEESIALQGRTVAIVSLSATNSYYTNDKLLADWRRRMESQLTDKNYVAIYTSQITKATPKSVPIFAKYQLFSAGVFMVMGVSFLFLLIAGVGITWLAGIQTPILREAPKQKKN
ncbi:hypothetical protein BY458DRAFT_522877 [Sporodiniella umbellata]|nr:hypothetical protein BY458DRAFT_522877 [Sporodiniella umbellata]